MRTILSIILDFLRALAIALWLGGLIAIGALVAPAAFHLVRRLPELHGDPALQTTIAGGVVGGSLRLFNVLCDVCGVLILLADLFWLKAAGDFRPARRWTIVSIVLTLLLLGNAFYLGHTLFPALDLAQQQNAMPRFDQLHRLYERLSGLQLPCLLGALFAGVMRNAPFHSARGRGDLV